MTSTLRDGFSTDEIKKLQMKVDDLNHRYFVEMTLDGFIRTAKKLQMKEVVNYKDVAVEIDYRKSIFQDEEAVEY